MTQLKKISSFASLGLNPDICNALATIGITTPTNVQIKAIPSLLQNTQNHLITAQTGTGKTLTYVLPLFQHLVQTKTEITSHFPSALVIVPNRELIIQCMDVMTQLNFAAKPRFFGLYQGLKAEVVSQNMVEGVDIVISSPDKIEKHINDGTLKLDKLRHIVIDECDTLLDMGYK